MSSTSLFHQKKQLIEMVNYDDPRAPIPQDEGDPDDVKDYKMPIRYVTLY
jgi:hypothetical protein